MNLKNKGTKFQIKVWNSLRKIKSGKIVTYQEISRIVGKPNSFRAVANAIGKNPYPEKIPCHRVIRSDGSLGGYSAKGGLKRKLYLLKKEGILLKKWIIPAILVDFHNTLW